MTYFLNFLFCPVFLLFFHTAFGQNENEAPLESIFSINSTILKEERTCLISLPDTYNDSSQLSKKYPIIILLDGNTHFKLASSTVDFMSSRRNNMMEESIIIAINNVDRERDLTVTKIKTTRVNTMGGGRDFLAFIERELIPYIDTFYRTKAHRILIGHSLAGLLTLNSYMDGKSIFDAYISIDPSIWWDEEMMKNKVDSISSSTLEKKLYIATANQGEANYERNKKRHDAFFELLKIKSSERVNVRIAYFEDENHRSVPLLAIYEGLKYLNQED